MLSQSVLKVVTNIKALYTSDKNNYTPWPRIFRLLALHSRSSNLVVANELTNIFQGCLPEISRVTECGRDHGDRCLIVWRNTGSTFGGSPRRMEAESPVQSRRVLWYWANGSVQDKNIPIWNSGAVLDGHAMRLVNASRVCTSYSQHRRDISQLSICYHVSYNHQGAALPNFFLLTQTRWTWYGWFIFWNEQIKHWCYFWIISEKI